MSNPIPFEDGPMDGECPVCGKTGYYLFIFPESEMTYSFETGGTMCMSYDADQIEVVESYKNMSTRERDMYGLWREPDPFDVLVYYHPADGDDSP